MFLIPFLVSQMLQDKQQSLSGLMHGFTTRCSEQLFESADTNQEHLSETNHSDTPVYPVFVWNAKPGAQLGRKPAMAVPSSVSLSQQWSLQRSLRDLPEGRAELPELWDV